MTACADPAVRMRFLHFAVAARELPKTLPVVLPVHGLNRRRPPSEEHRRIVVTLRRGEGEASARLFVKDTELGTGDKAFARLEMVFEKVLSSPENEDLLSEIVAASEVPFRDVVRVHGALLKAGLEPERVVFSAGDPQ